MNVTLWNNFSKRKNSTKIPSTAGATATCVLKEDTSIMEPTIILNGFGMFDYNYAYIQDFGRYYFITDIRTKGPNTEMSFTCDVLATYKAAITGSSQYIVRANTTLDPMIRDPLNPPICRTLIKYKQLATLANDIIQYSGGSVVSTYIVGVVNKTGVDYCACTQAQLASILNLAFGASITSQFYDMKNCIVSLIRVPYAPPTSTKELCIGEINTGQQAHVISDGILSTVIADALVPFASDDHENYYSYVDFPPYTQGVIYLPFVGLVPLDMDIVASRRKVGVTLKLDPKTADMVYIVKADGNRILGTYAGNCGASLPIVGQTQNTLAMPTAMLTTAAGILSDNPMLAASGAISAAMSQQRNTQINGSLSSFIGAELDPTIWIETYTKQPVSWTLDNMKSSQGVLVMKQATVSSYSGYVQTQNAHVAITGSDKERNEVESLMNSGIFIE